MSNLNLFYTRKNLSEARKQLFEEENYPLINVQTRAAFLMSSGSPDSSASIQFSNARDDVLLRFARLLFRYRLNLDKLFKPVWEPALLTHDEIAKLEPIKIDSGSAANLALGSLPIILNRETLQWKSGVLSDPLTKGAAKDKGARAAL